MEEIIPVCEPTLAGNEKKYADECITTNWISSQGRFIEEFERAFAQFCKVKHGVSCCNGTIALHLGLVALGINKGDEVILPTFTMAACVNAILYTGATPVFVDADKETWCIDAAKIEEKVTRKTKAIMPVHIYGHPCNMDTIMGIAKKHGLAVIEDGAEAHGAEHKGKKVGGIGHIGCFSFYANKIITTGEGGMVVTNSDELANKARSLKNLCFGKGDERFMHTGLGYNYRMTNIQAAIGLAQMEKANELVQARRRHAQSYTQLLKGVTGLTLPTEKQWAKNAYWMYGIVLGDEIRMSKQDFMKKMAEQGIETRPFFIPLHQQPYLKDGTLKNAPDCSGVYEAAEWLGKRGLYLPSSSSLKESQIKRVCDAVKGIVEETRQ